MLTLSKDSAAVIVPRSEQAEQAEFAKQKAQGQNAFGDGNPFNNADFFNINGQPFSPNRNSGAPFGQNSCSNTFLGQCSGRRSKLSQLRNGC